MPKFHFHNSFRGGTMPTTTRSMGQFNLLLGSFIDHVVRGITDTVLAFLEVWREKPAVRRVHFKVSQSGAIYSEGSSDHHMHLLFHFGILFQLVQLIARGRRLPKYSFHKTARRTRTLKARNGQCLDPNAQGWSLIVCCYE